MEQLSSHVWAICPRKVLNSLLRERWAHIKKCCIKILKSTIKETKIALQSAVEGKAIARNGFFFTFSPLRTLFQCVDFRFSELFRFLNGELCFARQTSINLHLFVNRNHHTFSVTGTIFFSSCTCYSCRRLVMFCVPFHKQEAAFELFSLINWRTLDCKILLDRINRKQLLNKRLKQCYLGSTGVLVCPVRHWLAFLGIFVCSCRLSKFVENIHFDGWDFIVDKHLSGERQIFLSFNYIKKPMKNRV